MTDLGRATNVVPGVGVGLRVQIVVDGRIDDHRSGRCSRWRGHLMVTYGRKEYFELGPDAAARIRGLIYPVPDPAFPWLGAHLTRGIDGRVHAGPNAVLALRREGYRWRNVSARDLGEVLGYPGFWRLARRHARSGVAELARSMSRRAFAAALSRLVPGITAADLVCAPAGVRAQAVGVDGALLNDFVIQAAPRQVHVLNAPSPAATSALEIARYVADRLTEVTPG